MTEDKCVHDEKIDNGRVVGPILFTFLSTVVRHINMFFFFTNYRLNMLIKRLINLSKKYHFNS